MLPTDNVQLYWGPNDEELLYLWMQGTKWNCCNPVECMYSRFFNILQFSQFCWNHSSWHSFDYHLHIFQRAFYMYLLVFLYCWLFSMLCYTSWIFIKLLPAGSAAGSSAGIVFTHGWFFFFFAPQGRHVAPIKVKLGRSAPPCQISPWSVRGWGLWPPKLKKFEFCQYNCP